MAASSSDQCHRCKAYRHFQRDCPQQVQKNRPKPDNMNLKNTRSGGRGKSSPKWCSYHNTTAHSDAECEKQQEIRANKQQDLQGLVANLALVHSAGQVNLPNIGSAHLAQSTPATAPQVPAEPTSFEFPFSAQGAPPAAAISCSAFCPDAPGGICRHSGGTFIYLLRNACTGPPLAFRGFGRVHDNSCGDVAWSFSLRRVVHPDGYGQRRNQQLPRPGDYTRSAGQHVRRRRP